MASRSGYVAPQPTAPPPPKKKTRAPVLPWLPMLVVTVPVAIGWYYLVIGAPAQLPVPPGLEVPFPSLIPYLESMISWCASNGILVALAGAAIIGGTALASAPGRYATGACILVFLFVGFTWYSVSAPIERLLKAVENRLPEERQVPDWLPGQK